MNLLDGNNNESASTFMSHSDSISSISARLSVIEGFGLTEVIRAVGDIRNHLDDLVTKSELITSLVERNETEYTRILKSLSSSDRKVQDVDKNVCKLKEESVLQKDAIKDVVSKVKSIESHVDLVDDQLASQRRSTEHNQKRFVLDVMRRLDMIEKSQQVQLESLKSSMSSAGPVLREKAVLESLIGTVQRLVADLKFEQSAKHRLTNVIWVWHAECLKSREKKLALTQLVSHLYMRLRNHFSHLKFTTALDTVVIAITDQVKQTVEEFKKCFMETVMNRVDSCELIAHSTADDLTALQTSLNELGTHRHDVLEHIASVQRSAHEYTDAKYESLKDHIQASVGGLANLTENISRQDQRITALESKQSRSDSMVGGPQINADNDDRSKQFFSDILLLWNSVKQIEAEKVDHRTLNHALDDQHDKLIQLIPRPPVKEVSAHAVKVDHGTSTIDALHVTSTETANIPAVSAKSAQSSNRHAPSAVTYTSRMDRSGSILIRSSTPRPSTDSVRSRGSLSNVEKVDLGLYARGKRIPPAGGWGLNRTILN
jgi:chromosome segregation ATPase